MDGCILIVSTTLSVWKPHTSQKYKYLIDVSQLRNYAHFHGGFANLLIWDGPVRLIATITSNQITLRRVCVHLRTPSRSEQLPDNIFIAASYYTKGASVVTGLRHHLFRDVNQDSRCSIKHVKHSKTTPMCFDNRPDTPIQSWRKISLEPLNIWSQDAGKA